MAAAGLNTSESIQQAFHYLFPNEVPELKRLALFLPENSMVVNIGAGAGTSTLAFLEARPDLRVVSIDKEAKPSPLGSLHSERKVIVAAGYIHRLEQIEGDSREVGRKWKRPPVDLVFVDGDHSLEGCAGDVLCWLRHLKSGGLMVLHDYGKENLYPEGPREDAPHPYPFPEIDLVVDRMLRPNFTLTGQVESLVSFRVP